MDDQDYQYRLINTERAIVNTQSRLTTPELNRSALRTLSQQVQHCKAGYSTSRTCEIGLSEHSGIDYQLIVYLVNECSRHPTTAIIDSS